MRRANEGRWYTVPLRIIPERGQGPENTLQPVIKQRCDVLHDDVLGSKLANKPGVFKPEAGSGPIQSAPASIGEADVLAGKSSAYDIDADTIVTKALFTEGSNVAIALHLGPMFRQHAAAERFDFAEGYGFEAASALQPKAKTANAAEQIKHPELAHGNADSTQISGFGVYHECADSTLISG